MQVENADGCKAILGISGSKEGVEASDVSSSSMVYSFSMFRSFVLVPPLARWSAALHIGALAGVGFANEHPQERK